MNIREQVERFWKIFRSEQNNLEKALDANNEDEVNEIVKIIATYFEELANCTLEVEKEDDFYCITFNSDGDKNAQYICALMKLMAPDEVIEKWIVNAFMPPLSNRALNTILKLENAEYDHHAFDVYYTIDEVNRLFNIEVYCEAFNYLDPNKALDLTRYLIKLFVGETLFDANIGNINAINTLSDLEHSCKLADLYEVMLTTIEENDWPVYDDPTKIYMVYKLADELKDNTVRNDMLMVFTSNPHMIAETLNGDAYIADQFNDFGGEFGYLYYPHHNDPKRKQEFQKKLASLIDDVLYEKMHIARTIGGAYGTTYCYVDLAIFDKENFNKLLPVLQQKFDQELEYARFEQTRDLNDEKIA